MSSVLVRGVVVWSCRSFRMAAESQTAVPTKAPPDRRHTQGASASHSPSATDGLKMLQAAEAEAKALPAPMRVFASTGICPPTRTLIPSKARSLRSQAFESTLSIEDDDESKILFRIRFSRNCCHLPRRIWRQLCQRRFPTFATSTHLHSRNNMQGPTTSTTRLS